MHTAKDYAHALYTLRCVGTVRPESANRRVASFADLADASKLELDSLRELLDTMCKPTQFTDPTLVKLDGDRYANAIHWVGFDHCEILERADGSAFDVRTPNAGAWRVVSSHATIEAAADAAIAFDEAPRGGYSRPVDATYHCADNDRAREMGVHPSR